MKQIFYSQLIGKKATVKLDLLAGETYAVFDNGIHVAMLNPITATTALSQGAVPLEEQEEVAPAEKKLFPKIHPIGEIDIPLTEEAVRAIVRQEVSLWQNGIKAGSIPRYNEPKPEPTALTGDDQNVIDQLFGS
jgi:hypothetical protein